MVEHTCFSQFPHKMSRLAEKNPHFEGCLYHPGEIAISSQQRCLWWSVCMTLALCEPMQLDDFIEEINPCSLLTLSSVQCPGKGFHVHIGPCGLYTYTPALLQAPGHKLPRWKTHRVAGTMNASTLSLVGLNGFSVSHDCGNSVTIQ